MKTSFKVTLHMLMLGWIVFAFLCAWGSHQEIAVRSFIALAGFILCAMGAIGCYASLANRSWWDSVEELSKKKEEAQETISRAMKVSVTLSAKLVEVVESFENDKTFLINALNAHWNEANTQLQRTDLGDIERKNYQYQLAESKRLMTLYNKS